MFKGGFTEIVSFQVPIVKSLVLNKVVVFSYGYFILFQLPLKKEEEIFNKIGKG